MFEIRNKENKRLAINLISGTIDLLAKSTAVLRDEDFSSSHLQNLLRSGKVILVSKEDKSKPKWIPKKGGSSNKVVSETEEKIISEVSDSGDTGELEVSEPEIVPEESPVIEQLETKSNGVREKERKKSSNPKRSQ